MISKRAVSNFLDRACRDSNKAKRFSDRALDSKLESLGAFFHTEPRRAQKICYLLGWVRESYLFLLGMGGGKALGDSEPVLMGDGSWKPIADITEGDLVIGRDGQPHPVLGVFPQGKKEVVEITFSSGATSLCSLDHLWTVRSAKGRERVLSVREILKDGLFYVSGNAKHYTPVVQPIRFQAKAEDLPIHPYALGVLIGDGALCGCNCSVTLGPKKKRGPFPNPRNA